MLRVLYEDVLQYKHTLKSSSPSHLIFILTYSSHTSSFPTPFIPSHAEGNTHARNTPENMQRRRTRVCLEFFVQYLCFSFCVCVCCSFFISTRTHTSISVCFRNTHTLCTFTNPCPMWMDTEHQLATPSIFLVKKAIRILGVLTYQYHQQALGCVYWDSQSAAVLWSSSNSFSPKSVRVRMMFNVFSTARRIL